MRYRSFGETGLFVSEICLGTMSFGGKGEVWRKIGALQQKEVNQLVARALEAGVNFIDTADVYSEGLSEVLTGNALKDLKIPRENVLIATKVFGQMGEGPNARGASRHNISNGIHASLKRLQVDYIDLYQIHGFDPATPIEETVYALNRLVRQGDVRYVGVSNWAAWQIMKAVGIARHQGCARFKSVQAYYSLAGRDLERELVPFLQSEKLGLMVWSPLAGGLLSGKYHEDSQKSSVGRRDDFDFPPVNRDRAKHCVEAMQVIAKEKGVSVAQIALAWLLHQPVVSTVIVGARRMDQLEDNLLATKVFLSQEELLKLNEVSALPKEYPGWMLERQGAYRRSQLLESGV